MEIINNDDVNDDPVFKFDYGFNPLRFLADYIRWSHPSSVEERRIKKENSLNFLQARAEHSKIQLQSSSQLKQLSKVLDSGIIWGPVTGPLSSTSIECICQPVCAGTVVIELSSDSDFSEVAGVPYNIIAEEPLLGVGPEMVAPVKTTIDGLLAGTKYYIRCYLQPKNYEQINNEKTNNGEEIINQNRAFSSDDVEPENRCYQISSFYTLPLEVIEEGDDEVIEETKIDEISLVAVGHTNGTAGCRFNLKSLLDSHFDSNSKPKCVIGCVLGEIFDSTRLENFDSYWPQLYDINRRCGLEGLKVLHDDSIVSNPLLENYSIILGWCDTRSSSDSELRAEERIYKQFEHDTKKWMKKYGGKKKTASSKDKGKEKDTPPQPVLQRAEISPSLYAISKGFPVTITESSTRNLCRVQSIGPNIQLFILDSRCGYIGRQQVKWLKENLSNSSAMWKIVVSGVSVGLMSDSSNISDQSVAVSDENADAPKGVQMQLPEPKDLDDIDNEGRLKSSIQYVVASMQKAEIDNAAAEAEEEEEHAEKEGEEEDENGTSIKQNNTVEEVVEIVNPIEVSDETPLEEKLESNESVIESGIVFLTGGNFMLPFIATYDPYNKGKPYCIEVAIGSVRGVASSSYQYNEVPNMGTQFLYNDCLVNTNDNNDTSYSGAVTLLENGSLKVTISSSSPSSSPSIIYENKFYITSNTNHS